MSFLSPFVLPLLPGYVFVCRRQLAMIRLGGALMVAVGLLLTLGIWTR